jgi:hypothetical protein
MMLLPFTTEQAAQERNMIEAIRRGCDMVTTRYWWPMVEHGDGWALAVGDGEGLSDEELTMVVTDEND